MQAVSSTDCECHLLGKMLSCFLEIRKSSSGSLCFLKKSCAGSKGQKIDWKTLEKSPKPLSYAIGLSKQWWPIFSPPTNKVRREDEAMLSDFWRLRLSSVWTRSIFPINVNETELYLITFLSTKMNWCRFVNSTKHTKMKYNRTHLILSQIFHYTCSVNAWILMLGQDPFSLVRLRTRKHDEQQHKTKGKLS